MQTLMTWLLCSLEGRCPTCGEPLPGLEDDHFVPRLRRHCATSSDCREALFGRPNKKRKSSKGRVDVEDCRLPVRGGSWDNFLG